VKEFLFIVVIIITTVVRCTFAGNGAAEQREESGKRMAK